MSAGETTSVSAPEGRLALTARLGRRPRLRSVGQD